VTTPTVEQALRRAAAVLRQAGIDNPIREARLLLGHALGRTPADLLRDTAAPIDTTAFDRFVARRAAHEPMAYILGRQGFWSLEFLVSPATLIPRPDSESIVEAALVLPPPERVLDLGTGTGCLLLSVLHERPSAFGVGVDLAPAAAALARRNAERLGLADRAAFLCCDWANGLNGRFDLVLSNPPYIEHSAIPALMPEVAQHEPQTALDGGLDGLDAYRAIVQMLPALLTPRGAAVLELGIGQGPSVAALAATVGYTASFRPDLAGIDRAIVLLRD
jgi:release factor glutamine methyltransferase